MSRYWMLLTRPYTSDWAMNRKVTIREVAAELGVNPSTVSRALNPKTQSMITPQVVQQVQEAAERMGYYPNRMAAALKHNRSHTIGVLIPDLMNPVFPAIIRGIQDTLDRAGYTLITANTDNNVEYARTALQKMRERSVDGYIMATAQRDDQLIQESLHQKLPMVLINRIIEEKTGLNAVVNDDAAGIDSAVDHLVSLGHKQIAFISGPQNTSTGFDRREEFIAKMQRQKLDAGLVEMATAYSIEEGRRALAALLGKKVPLSAVIAANDMLALGCIDAINACGLRCPEDISVVGFNNMPFLERTMPALTTVAIPHYEIGARAAENILQQLDNTDYQASISRLQPKLIVRHSTAKFGGNITK